MSSTMARSAPASEGSDQHIASTRPVSQRHIPALDGVRALAILMVVVHHTLYQVPVVSLAQNLLVHVTGQGWVGVDLFFVLSGFLITGILLDIKDPVHALRKFYLRRILRIVPVYVAFLLFSLFAARALGILTADESAQLHATQLWFWTYSVNLLIALHSWSAASFPTVHLWSLAVEEQFYLIWPLAVLLMAPRTTMRAAVGCIIAAEVIRLLFILGGAGGQANYVLLPSRMDSLAAGAFLACAFRNPALWARVLNARVKLASVCSIILVAVILYHHTIANQDPLEQLVAFPAIVGLASVVVSTAAAGSRFLAGSVLRFVGKISYGMYLWHLEVLRFVSRFVPLSNHPTAGDLWFYYGILLVGTVGGTILLSLVSWHVVEQPFLRLKRLLPYS
jgi:peptidoglycan/LPS O-acetylase OafA/YrhL